MAESIDVETGEVMKEPDYVKLYIKHMCAIKGVTTLQTKIFFFLLQNMNFENVSSYGSHSKRKFLDEHKTSNASFNNNIGALVKCGLVAKLGKCEFLVNKKYAVKVNWSKVSEIKWIATYSENGVDDEVIIK